MRGGVVKSDEIVLESAGDHVQKNATFVKMAEAGDHLGHRIGMHVNGLDRDQRAKRLSVLKDQIGDKPGVDDGVVGVNENSGAAGLFAPSGDVNDLLDITIAREILGLRAGGEDFDLRSIEDAHSGIGPPEC